MSQHLPSSQEMFLCVSGTSKKLLHGALKEAEILTSLLPNVFAQLGLVFGCWLPGTNCLVLNTKMFFLNLAWIMGTSTQLMGVSTPPKGLQMFLCFSGTYKPNLVHGTLMEAEILTSLSPNVFVQLGLVFGHQHSSHRCVNTSQVV